MRIMAIDYGKTRVGIAITDPLGIIPQPYLTLKPRSKRVLLKKLKELITDNEIGLVILGNPVSNETQPTRMGLEIIKFANSLRKVVNIEIKFWDEQYTSQYAARMLKQFNDKNLKDKIHKVGASIILEEYLKSCISIGLFFLVSLTNLL